MDSKEQSLRDALEHARCHELPRTEQEQDNPFWMEAIALVQKRNGKESYAILRRLPNRDYKIQTDYGTMSPVEKVLEIYPYLIFDNRRFDLNKTTAQKRATLHLTHPDQRHIYQNCSEEEIDRLYMEFIIEEQKKTVKSIDVRDEIEERLKQVDEEANIVQKNNADIPAANRAKRIPKNKK